MTVETKPQPGGRSPEVAADEYRGLSIRQPYAAQICLGRKTIETRGYVTSYRGPILICSTKRPISPDHQPPTFLNGYALALVTLADCRPLESRDRRGACLNWDQGREDGRFAWILKDPIPLLRPFPIRGRQGLFKLSIDERRQLLAGVIR